MSSPFLPPYNAPFLPVPQITPFTYRDGVTYLDKLESITRYINMELIPFVNGSYSDLADDFEEQVNILIAAVNAAIQEIIDDSIVVQDPVVAGLIGNLDSQTSNALDLRYALKSALDAIQALVDSGRLSETTLNDTYAAKAIQTIVETGRLSEVSLDATYAAKSAFDANVDSVDGRLDSLETLTSTGRLSQTSLDGRYLRNDIGANVVFIGSSNALPQFGWTTKLCANHGWNEFNYSVGGGRFTSTDSAKFIIQLNTAIADSAFTNDSVKYIFVVDMSNDIRGGQPVGSEAETFFATAKASFPNARIIMLPVIWTFVFDNYSNADRARGVSQRIEEVSRAGWAYDVEIIDYTWLWFWDELNWSDTPTGYHLNPAGCNKLVYYIEEYLSGHEVDNPLGWKFVTQTIAGGSATLGMRIRRNHGQVTVLGTINAYANVPIDTDLGILNKGTWPTEKMVVEVSATTRERGALYFFENGIIRTMTALAAGETYYVQTDYAVI